MLYSFCTAFSDCCIEGRRLHIANSGGFTAPAGSQQTAHFNNFSKGIAIDNGGSAPLDAAENWWGCAAGPGHNACAAIPDSNAIHPLADNPFASICELISKFAHHWNQPKYKKGAPRVNAALPFSRHLPLRDVLREE